MKRVFSIIFILLFSYSQLSAQTVGRNKSDGLNGAVRSVRIENFDCSSSPGICLEKPYRTSTVTYDNWGNEIEQALYKADGSIEHLSNYSYNADGSMSGWKEYYGKGVANAEGLNKHAAFTYRSGKLAEAIVYREDSVAHKSTYVYDDRGNKIQELNSGEDALFTSRTYKYDSADNLVEESSDGKSYSTKVERAFDGAGNVVEERYFDNGSLRFISTKIYENRKLVDAKTVKPDGKLFSTTRNVYSSSGKLIESIVVSENTTSKTTVRYDETGLIKSKETVTTRKGNRIGSEDAPPGRVLIKYNQKGFEIERLDYSESGALLRRQTSGFDGRGLPTETIFYKEDGTVEDRRIYEYDTHRNLIKTIFAAVSENGETRYLVWEQRIISYY